MTRFLSKCLQEKACKELNEVPDRIESDIEYIKDWLRQQSHLKVRLENQWLLGFLRGCKFSLQRTKEKLDMYYTMRTMMQETFANRDPFSPEIQIILEKGIIVPMPVPHDSANSTLIMFRWGGSDPETMPLCNIAKVYFMIIDILMHENDNITIAGKQVVSDYTGFPLGYLFQFSPPYIKKLLTCMQLAYPVRIKGMYCINTPLAFETVFNMIKSFMSEKLKGRTFMFSESNSSNLYSYVPRTSLPKEYEGSSESINKLTVEWKKKIESYKDWFIEENKYGSDEMLKPNTRKTSTEIFGIEGSFRKLTID